MIRLEILRTPKYTKLTNIKNANANLKKQILEGFKSTPFNETQVLDITIKDKPFKRFLYKLAQKDTSKLEVELDANFTRAYQDEKNLSAKHYCFSSFIPMREIEAIEKDKDLVPIKNSFVNRIMNWVNKSIEE